MESQLNIQWVPTKAAPTGVCVEATAPARVDLAGGWTDTPPVSYELGGKVLGLSLKIDEAVQCVAMLNLLKLSEQ